MARTLFLWKNISCYNLIKGSSRSSLTGWLTHFSFVLYPLICLVSPTLAPCTRGQGWGEAHDGIVVSHLCISNSCLAVAQMVRKFLIMHKDELLIHFWCSMLWGKLPGHLFKGERVTYLDYFIFILIKWQLSILMHLNLSSFGWKAVGLNRLMSKGEKDMPPSIKLVSDAGAESPVHGPFISLIRR